MSHGRFYNLDFICRTFFCALLLAMLVRPATRADARADRAALTLAGGDAPHVNSWATLRLTLPSMAGGNITVEIRDLRGGPTIRRRLAVFRRHLLMPMPYVIGAAGLGGNWPVIITVRHAGRRLRVLNLKVDLPLANSIHGAFVAVRHHMQSQVNALSAALGKPLTPMVFSMRELAASPVLNFASCRWLLLDRTTAHELSRRRVLALLSLGVRLVSISNRPPAIPPASAWHRGRKSAAGYFIWTTPHFDGFSHGPPVVVPHLTKLRLPRVHAPGSWKLAAWAIGPVTILMLILLRWAVTRRRYFILSTAIGAGLLSAATVFWLTATTPSARTTLQWQTYIGHSELTLRTAITMNRSPHGSGRAVTHADGIALPLAWSGRAWFAFHGVVNLHRNAAALKYPVGRRVRILAYKTQAVFSPVLPRYGSGESRTRKRSPKSGLSPDQSVLFADGQIFLPVHPHQGRDFYNWLGQKDAMIQSTLHLWLLLQFNPHRRYDLLTGAHGIKIIALPNLPA